MNNASIHVYLYQFIYLLEKYKQNRNISIRKIFKNLFEFMNTIMTSLSKQDKSVVGSGQKVKLQSFLTNFCHNKVLPGGENSCFTYIH